VSSAAVQLAKQIFGSLAGKRAMILGAGEMAELALECLADQGVRTSIVANRTFERATEVAERHGAEAACRLAGAGADDDFDIENGDTIDSLYAECAEVSIGCKSAGSLHSPQPAIREKGHSKFLPRVIGDVPMIAAYEFSQRFHRPERLKS
jgi:shikimate 5-dehydrogenase